MDIHISKIWPHTLQCTNEIHYSFFKLKLILEFEFEVIFCWCGKITQECFKSAKSCKHVSSMKKKLSDLADQLTICHGNITLEFTVNAIYFEQQLSRQLEISN